MSGASSDACGCLQSLTPPCLSISRNSPISPVDPVTPITPASPTTFIAAGSSPGGAGAAPSPISKSELAKLDKLGRKDSKRVKAVLKDQAKADERTLEYAVKEVARLQVSHKDALKAESKTIKHFDEALKVCVASFLPPSSSHPVAWPEGVSLAPTADPAPSPF